MRAMSEDEIAIMSRAKQMGLGILRREDGRAKAARMASDVAYRRLTEATPRRRLLCSVSLAAIMAGQA